MRLVPALRSSRLLAASLTGLLVVLAIFGTGGLHCTARAAESGPIEFPPGILTTIPPDVAVGETFSFHDLIEIRSDGRFEQNPIFTSKSRTIFEMAESVNFSRSVWCLELAFKPLRMIRVDVPSPSGKMQRKLIWYLVYRVRNTGAGRVPGDREEAVYTTESAAQDGIRFIPQFVLTSRDRNSQGDTRSKAYLDRILPVAMDPIRRRELPRGELLNSVSMARQLLPAETTRKVGGLWGVAIWEDVDPEIDYFSVYVGGLSNAYRRADPSGVYRTGDPPGTGREIKRKTLQLNFWRPGDAAAEHEREIRFGIPPGKAGLYDVDEGVAHRWIYR